LSLSIRIHLTFQFVSELIEPLYHQVGVRVLATEFLRSRHIAQINLIVTADEYDERADRL